MSVPDPGSRFTEKSGPPAVPAASAGAKTSGGGLTPALLGGVLAGYLRLVRSTSRLIVDPPDMYERLYDSWPFIAAMWHGQHFLAPFFRQGHEDVRVLISRHADGEINARAAARLGLGLVRGSGGRRTKMLKKGGHIALRGLLRALDEGATVALTADVPKGPARQAGPGIVTLARISGRPIIPIAVATSNRYIFKKSWDEAALNLPFSRMALTIGEPVHVPADADPEAIAAGQAAVTRSLDAATERAYALVDRRVTR